MKEQEWIEEAEEWEAKAEEAFEAGDDVLSDAYHRRAAACRHAAMYAPDDDEVPQSNADVTAFRFTLGL